MTDVQPILSVRELGLRFGGLVALNAVSFDVTRASITGLIGPNGAGKTTLFNCITGFYKAAAGEILLRTGAKEVDVRQLLGKGVRFRNLARPRQFASDLRFAMMGGSHLVSKAGIARTFQNIRLFREMTCVENLLVAQHFRFNRNLFSGVLSTASFIKAERDAIAAAYRWLKLVGMADKANRLAGELPYGLQRRLEIARAMASHPAVVCLDEPAAGLNPRETAELSELIMRLRDEFGVTVLLVEHDMKLVMGLCEHIVVLDRGCVIASGSPQHIRSSAAVLAAYLGPDGDAAEGERQ